MVASMTRCFKSCEAASVGWDLRVEARVADLDVDDRLTLPRLDTNDLPS